MGVGAHRLGDLPSGLSCQAVDQFVAMFVADTRGKQCRDGLRHPSDEVGVWSNRRSCTWAIGAVEPKHHGWLLSCFNSQQNTPAAGGCFERTDRLVAGDPEPNLTVRTGDDYLCVVLAFRLPYRQSQSAIGSRFHIASAILNERTKRARKLARNVDIHSNLVFLGMKLVQEGPTVGTRGDVAPSFFPFR